MSRRTESCSFIPVERTAIDPPRPCFALEQHAGNSLCPECPYRRDCADLMGILVNNVTMDRVSVDKVAFNFMPPQFVKQFDTEGDDPDIDNIQNVYAFCHKWVFGRQPRTGVGRKKNFILRRVEESGASIKMFMLANMVAWKDATSAVFSPNILTSSRAVAMTKAYSKACEERFGAFDILAMDRLSSEFFKRGGEMASKDFETMLFNSEVLAGNWILDYRLTHYGKTIERLYDQQEMALNPYWLAIESNYQEMILFPHHRQPDPDCSEQLRTHRWNVTQVLAKLKKYSRLAVSVFSAHQRIMPAAIRHVLAKKGFRADEFEIQNVPVTQSFRLWGRLASAIQQYELLSLMEGAPSAFDGHFSQISSVGS